MSYTNHCGAHCGTDWRGREYHFHGGTQRVRRANRSMSRYYRRRDPWDKMPRDKMLDVQFMDRGSIRTAERELLQPRLWTSFEEDV